jgi:hypothetical protein
LGVPLVCFVVPPRNFGSGFPLQSFFIFSGFKCRPSPKKIKKGFPLQSLTLLTAQKKLPQNNKIYLFQTEINNPLIIPKI